MCILYIVYRPYCIYSPMLIDIKSKTSHLITQLTQHLILSWNACSLLDLHCISSSFSLFPPPSLCLFLSLSNFCLTSLSLSVFLSVLPLCLSLSFFLSYLSVSVFLSLISVLPLCLSLSFFLSYLSVSVFLSLLLKS